MLMPAAVVVQGHWLSAVHAAALLCAVPNDAVVAAADCRVQTWLPALRMRCLTAPVSSRYKVGGWNSAEPKQWGRASWLCAELVALLLQRGK